MIYLYEIMFGEYQSHLSFSRKMKLRVFFIFCLSLILDCKGQGNFDTIAFIQKWPVCKNKTLCPLKGKLTPLL